MTEKELKLRLGMRIMGLNNSVYWLVWFLYSLVMVLLSTLILIGSGAAFQFDVFTNTNFFVNLLAYSVFGLSVVSVGFFLSTLLSRTKTAQTAGYAIILVGFVFQSILIGGYGMLIDLLYYEGVAEWVKVATWIFQFYPPFNFAKIFSDVTFSTLVFFLILRAQQLFQIARLSSSTIDFRAGKITQGPGFFWSDLYKEQKTAKVFGIDLVSPPPIEAIYYLLMDTVFFLILAWYLDNVIPGEHGSPRPWYFPFTAEYWGCGKKSRKSCCPKKRRELLIDEMEPLFVNKDKEDFFSPSGEDEDVVNEERRAFEEENCALRVLNLSKNFTQACNKKVVNAVDGVSFVIENNTTFCLLGHNGAGKSLHFLFKFLFFFGCNCFRFLKQLQSTCSLDF